MIQHYLQPQIVAKGWDSYIYWHYWPMMCQLLLLAERFVDANGGCLIWRIIVESDRRRSAPSSCCATKKMAIVCECAATCGGYGDAGAGGGCLTTMKSLYCWSQRWRGVVAIERDYWRIAAVVADAVAVDCRWVAADGCKWLRLDAFSDCCCCCCYNASAERRYLWYCLCLYHLYLEKCFFLEFN